MIPLRSTEPVYAATPVTVSLIAANVAVFLFEAAMPEWGVRNFTYAWGIVPDRLRLVTLLTSMFLHGGWLHLGGNMLFLWVFGRNLEDRLGPGKFLGFYLLCGAISGAVQVIAAPYSPVPTVGASGAIAGVMGAYLLKFPRARIITLIPILVFVTTMEIPAPLLLLYWFAIQLFSSLTGFGTLTTQGQYNDGGIAWFAHVGGFVAGLLLIGRFKERRRRPIWWADE